MCNLAKSNAAEITQEIALPNATRNQRRFYFPVKKTFSLQRSVAAQSSDVVVCVAGRFGLASFGDAAQSQGNGTRQIDLVTDRDING